jgi:KH domain
MAESHLCDTCNHAKIEHVSGSGNCQARNCSCAMFVSVISTVLSHIPAEAEITGAEYEGENIVLYTRNPKFLQQNSYILSDVVKIVKRSIVIRTEVTEIKDGRTGVVYVSRGTLPKITPQKQPEREIRIKHLVAWAKDNLNPSKIQQARDWYSSIHALRKDSTPRDSITHFLVILTFRPY